jgi:hypothetical protein
MADNAESERPAAVFKTNVLSPEWATVRTVTAIFGLSRTEIFRLIAEKKLVSVHYRTRATARKGIRLIELESVRNFLRSALQS